MSCPKCNGLLQIHFLILENEWETRCIICGEIFFSAEMERQRDHNKHLYEKYYSKRVRSGALRKRDQMGRL